MYYIRTDELGMVTVILTQDGVVISFQENPENSDFIRYQEWLAEGNTPEPWPPAE
jgi:hypothetical protein